MFEFVTSRAFDDWIESLRDTEAEHRVYARLNRIQAGNFGDVRPVGEGVSELRIPWGPGYRIYFRKSGLVLILLLCGGTKATQAKDILKAKRLAKDWKR